MFRSASLLAVLFAALCLTGCGNNGAESKAVAIVDLDRVLKMTGTDLEIQNAVQERQTRIRDDLSKFQKRLEEAWTAKRDEFGEEPSEEQQGQLQQFLVRLNQESQQAQSQAQQNVTQFRQDLYQTFQEQVSPISLEVAKEQGYSIVLGQNPSILAFDTTIDITDAVVERMKQLQQESAAGLSSDGPLTGGEEGAPVESGGPISITPQLKTETPAETPLMETPGLNLPDATESKPATETEPATEIKPTTEMKPAAEEKPAEQPKAEAPKTEEAPKSAPETDSKPAEPKAEAKPEAKADDKPADKPAAEEKPADNADSKPADTEKSEENSPENE